MSSRRATRWCRPGSRLPWPNCSTDHLPNLVDYQFTAQMEDDLDAISRGEAGHVDYLRSFYFGNGTTGLKQQLARQGRRDRRPRHRPHADRHSPKDSEPIFVRVGRYGPFLEQGERRASLPDEMPPDEMTHRAALELLEPGRAERRAAGHCPERTSRSI